MSTETAPAPEPAHTSTAMPAAAATQPAPAPASTSAVLEPWFKDWVQADGTLNAKALDRLPDHLKPLKATWERSKTIEDLGTTSLNQQFLNGKKALAPLPADAPAPVQAERKALLDSINGVPPTPKDYNLTKPADLDEKYWMPKLAEDFSSWAHKNSVSPSAVREVVALQLANVGEQLAQQAQYEDQFWTKQQETFDATIRRDNIPSDRAAVLVERGAIALGLDLQNEGTKTFLKGADARLMAMRHAMAIGEDRAINPSTSLSSESNPGELAHSARTDPSHPLYAAYWNKGGTAVSRSVHEAAVEKVNGWLKLDDDRKQKAAGARR